MRTTFNDVEEATGGVEQLPCGGYVMKILRAEDDAKGEFVKVSFDVAEGEFKDFFATAPDWAHETRIYYKGGAAAMFKRFYMNVSRDNADFDLAAFEANPAYVGLFDGKLFGAVVGLYKYIGQDGKPREKTEIARTLLASDVRAGKFSPAKDRLSKDREAFEKNSAAASSTPTGEVDATYTSDVPF